MDRTSTNIMELREAASMNDIGKVIAIMSDPSYTYEIGREAVGIALTLRHTDVAYQLLSYPGALDSFFDHPYMVDNGLRASVAKFIEMKKV